MSRTLPPNSSSSRQIAPLASHHSHSHQHQPQQVQSHTIKWTPYTPHPIELYPGPKNRLFLALRSGIDEEVDYALPKLVIASFDELDRFKLETWVDSVSALKEWPEKWVEGLELEVASNQLREESRSKLDNEDGKDGIIDIDLEKKKKLALSIIPTWTIPSSAINRATNSLLVLRNASFTNGNAKIICRTSFLNFLNKFFNLPISFLLEISLRNPEPIHHILNILQSIFPHLKNLSSTTNSFSSEIKFIFNEVLPKLFIQSKDQAILNNILPLLIMGLTIPNNTLSPTISKELIDILLNLIILRPVSSTSITPGLLDLSLDLLISFTQNPLYCKQILTSEKFNSHLKTLVSLLEFGSKITTATWENSLSLTGKVYRNPASEYIRNENSQKRRKLQREANQKQMEIFGGQGVKNNIVGDKPPILNKVIKERLWGMREPNRSISWMHETFCYSSTSQLLQVTFWYAYRDFFQNPSTVDPLLSASEVIKNVTVAFPGAMAKVWTDELGGQKFVIAGIGFRKGSDDQERFTCLWHNCPSPSTSTNPSSLLSHIQSTHLTTPQLQCQWAKCQHTPFTLSHLLTHLPNLQPIQVPEVITSHASTPEYHLSQSIITNRPIPPLARPFKLHFQGKSTPIDPTKRHPIGIPFLTSLILRNLSKTLKTELSLINVDEILEKKEEKKKHLLEERFGLPIPENVLREEKEEEDLIIGQDFIKNQNEYEAKLEKEQLDKAKLSFINIQSNLQDLAENNISGLAAYLGDALGW